MRTNRLSAEAKRLLHAAVLLSHGFTSCGRTAHGSYRFRHPNGARAYYTYSKRSPKRGWRTSLRFRGLWGWTGRIYASAANLDKWMTLHK